MSGRKMSESSVDKMMAEFALAKQSIAEGDYKGTAVKVELEAQLGRPDYDDDEYCSHCDGEGNVYCPQCEGDEGHVDEENQDAWIECQHCEGSGRIDCSNCEGEGVMSSGEGWSEDNCEDFIRKTVSDEAREALIYGNFYNDGSVDSEFTFTLPIAKAELAVEYIEAFKALADEIGNGMDTRGAGMHIAILNDPNGSYGTYGSHNELDEVCTENFVSSVQPLLPALYFLGSSTHESRGLYYRRPRISSPWHENGEKYCAINGGGGCFEYRLFETCYNKPEAFYDYLIVIANTLKFYSKTPHDTRMNLGTLGFKAGEGLTRFYYTENHLKALDKGLKLLRPKYKSLERLKSERGFKYTLKDFRTFEKQRELEWKREYTQEVKDRIHYERSRRYYQFVAEYYSSMEHNGKDYVQSALGKTPREYAMKCLKNQCKHLYGGAKGYVSQRKAAVANERTEYTLTV